MRMSQLLAPITIATLLLTGCGNEQPATRVMAQAETILGDMRAEGSMFAPEELQAVEATMADMKSDFADRDYRAVMEVVPQFNAQVKTLKEAVVSKQTLAAAAANEWNELNTEVPKTVDAIQVRVDSLAGTRLPRDISKETFEAAKTELEAMKAAWAEATAAATAGDKVAAADKGRDVAAKGEELKNKLGMNPALASASLTPPSGADITPAE